MTVTKGGIAILVFSLRFVFAGQRTDRQTDRQTGEAHACHAVIQSIGSALSLFSLLFCETASDTLLHLTYTAFLPPSSPFACFSCFEEKSTLFFFRRVLVNGTWKLKLGSWNTFLLIAALQQHARGHTISSFSWSTREDPA